jgi:hypothetical protein
MSTILIIGYFSFGLLGFMYIVLMHLKSCFTYFRQLYTAKYVTPTKIKTYLGLDFYEWSDYDDWYEILFFSSIRTFAYSLGTLVFWPFVSLFFLNTSIVKARARIEKDS